MIAFKTIPNHMVQLSTFEIRFVNLDIALPSSTCDKQNGEIQQNYHMIKQTPQPQKTQSLQQSQQKLWDEGINPRKAATKVRNVNYHVEIMKRRLKVLQGQEEYNRYRTIDQEKKINIHKQLHSTILKEREILRKSLEKVKDISQVKEKTQQLRVQIRQKIKEARKNLLEDKTDRTALISGDSLQHQNLIKQHRQRDWSENKQRRVTIQFQEEKKRQSVSRHVVDKLKTIRINKSIDTGSFIKKAQQSQQELARLMMYEQELLKKNSESLQASQVMRHKFNEVFTTANSNNSSRLLPEISSRTNNSKHTNSTEMGIL